MKNKLKLLIPILLLISFSSNVFAQNFELKTIQIKNQSTQAYVFDLQVFKNQKVTIFKIIDSKFEKSEVVFKDTQFFIEKSIIDTSKDFILHFISSNSEAKINVENGRIASFKIVQL